MLWNPSTVIYGKEWNISVTTGWSRGHLQDIVIGSVSRISDIL